MSSWRRPRKPVIPGERCPADRNNAHNDPKVTIDHLRTTPGRRYGTRTCGRCGRENVPVEHAHGESWSAWYYAWHTAPEPTVPVSGEAAQAMNEVTE